MVKIYVRGKLTARGNERADYLLYYQDNPIAIIEAKDNKAFGSCRYSTGA